MIIIPAIDLKDGKCVRLLQGRKEDVTVYSDDPASMARHWAGMGAELLHVVDLDGAFTGDQKNFDRIRAIRKAIDIPIEVGGGVRDIQRIEQLITLGVDRVIIGTAAAKDPEMVRRASDKFPGKGIEENAMGDHRIRRDMAQDHFAEHFRLFCSVDGGMLRNRHQVTFNRSRKFLVTSSFITFPILFRGSSFRKKTSLGHFQSERWRLQ